MKSDLIIIRAAPLVWNFSRGPITHLRELSPPRLVGFGIRRPPAEQGHRADVNLPNGRSGPLISSKVFMHDKSSLREIKKAERKAFIDSLTFQERSNYATQISQQVLKYLKDVDGLVVAGYWPKDEEADTKITLTLLHNKNATICLPRINLKTHHLTFHQWNPGDLLELNSFNILEPSIIQPRLEPDILLVPLLAFDKNGHRLGYGKGHYDRAINALLEQKDIKTLGIAFDIQMLDKIPFEPHDRVLEAVITPERIYKFK